MSTGSPRQLWLLPVLLITVIATALGALVARSVYRDQPPPPPAAIEPAPSSELPPNKQPGSPEVQGTADATAHPLYNTLRPIIQQYFDAINRKDYVSWTEVVSSRLVEETPEDTWRDNYRTTRDGSIVVYRIDVGVADNLKVLLQFTSTQSVEDAPPELQEPCIRWNVVYAYVKEKGAWKLKGGRTSATPKHERC